MDDIAKIPLGEAVKWLFIFGLPIVGVVGWVGGVIANHAFKPWIRAAFRQEIRRELVLWAQVNDWRIPRVLRGGLLVDSIDTGDDDEVVTVPRPTKGRP